MIFAAVLVLSPLTFANAQTAAPQSAITEFEVNGMKVLVKHRPGTPTVSAGLYFRGGVRNVTPDKAGIEGLALSVATEGSKSFPRQKLRTETSSIGTVISSGSNYDFSVMSLACTKVNFDTSWQMFVDVAMNPAFVPSDFDRVREGLLTGLRSQSDSPEGLLDSTNDSIVYAGHPYSIDPTGTPTTIAQLKAADVAAYYKTLLQTSRMLMVIVGDIDTAKLQTEITASFGKLPRGVYKDAPLPLLKFEKPTVDVTSKQVQTDYVKGTFAAPSIGDPDYYAMRTAITILQTQVFQEVRVKRNLSYAPDAELDNHLTNTAAISVSSVNPNESIRIMLGEIQRLKDAPVDADTLGQLGGYFLTTYYLGQETNAAQVSSLAQYELMGGGWRNSLNFLDRMRAVKPEEVQAVAKKYMKNLRFVVVGNSKDIDRSIFLQGQ